MNTSRRSVADVDVDARIASLVSPSALTSKCLPGLSNTRRNVPQGQIPLDMCTLICLVCIKFILAQPVCILDDKARMCRVSPDA